MKFRDTLVNYVFLISILCLFGFANSSGPSEHYDVLIKNTKIVDGTGSPAYKGDVAIKGEKIVAVGKVKGDAETVIDGSGLVTCPGFIDAHSHADMAIMKYPRAENLAMQGITTFIGGNCGKSAAPRKDLTFINFLSEVKTLGISPNYAPLVGHNTIRELVMGTDFKREATLEEIEEMKKYVEDAMRSGAFGLSVGLDYFPGEYAARREIIDLARIAGKFGGVLVPHLRHRNSHWPGETEEWKYGVYHGPIEDVWVGRYRGLWEAIEISRKAKVSLHIAHLCNVYRIPQPHPDFLEEAVTKATLWNIDKAIEEGSDVTFDVIVSTNDIVNLRPLIEEFIKSRTLALERFKNYPKEEFIKKIKTGEFREKIRNIYDAYKLKLCVIHTKADPFWMDRFKIVVCKNKEYEGKTIGEIARMRNTNPLEAIFDILVEDPETKWLQHIDEKELMHQALPIFLSHPAAMPSTDMGSLPPVEQAEGFEEGDSLIHPSPLACGAFADYIGTYVRERSALSLEEAVKKATSFPAQRFGLEDRGELRPGAYADIVVFDFNNIKKTGDFLRPAQPPEGIKYVFVNGKIVYKEKTHTGEKPGRVLRHRYENTEGR